MGPDDHGLLLGDVLFDRLCSVTPWRAERER